MRRYIYPAAVNLGSAVLLTPWWVAWINPGPDSPAANLVLATYLALVATFLVSSIWLLWTLTFGSPHTSWRARLARALGCFVPSVPWPLWIYLALPGTPDVGLLYLWIGLGSPLLFYLALALITSLLILFRKPKASRES